MNFEKRITEIIGKLSLQQKTALLHGISTMEFGGIPALGIPSVKCADGPQGIRLEDGTKTTALPCGMGLAATWNPETAKAFGGVIAEEAIANKIHVSLGPGINLMRTPLNGRNFEYYGEDPVLAGKIASGYVKGCQAKGVAATPKHLALNDQEICRTVGSSNCDKKTMRELYLEAFEIVIKEAKPWMLMSSYNRINGTYASQCKYTQQDFCKDECGFDGVMVSDWGGTHAAKEALRGGLDLEMGGDVSNWMNNPLMDQLVTNQITHEELDDHLRRVLRLIFRVTTADNKALGKCATATQAKVARAIGCESAVLLKNDGMLPLNVSKKRILVCGPTADFHHCVDLVHGGGSGAVHPKHEVTALEAIQARLGKKCTVEYEPGVLFHDAYIFPDALLDGEVKCEFYDDLASLSAGKKPFLKESHKSLQLHFGVMLAAGIESTNKKLLQRCYAMKVNTKFTPKKSETWHLGLFCTFFNEATLSINGKRLLSGEQTALMDHSVEFKVKAGQSYELEFTGFHFAASEDCICSVLLHSDLASQQKAALDAAKKADAVIYIGGSNHHFDREALGWGDVKGADVPGLELPDGQSRFISALTKANPNVFVGLVGGTVMDVEPWIDGVKALVDFWYPGQECGNVIVDILTGAASPEGHLPFTWGKDINDYACHANGNYPGVRDGYDPHVNYDEGIFIGYRHFDRAGIAPRFPFGFGLSYTAFKYAVDKKAVVTGKLKDKSLKVVISGSVENTGDRTGQALVQLYVSQPNCKAEKRPLKVLRNFTKVALEPGKKAPFQLELGWRDFAFFSTATDGFIAESGNCKLLVADGQSNIIVEIPAKI